MAGRNSEPPDERLPGVRDFEAERFEGDGPRVNGEDQDPEPPRGSPEWVAKIMDTGETPGEQLDRWNREGKTPDEEEAHRLHNQWGHESLNGHRADVRERSRRASRGITDFSFVGEVSGDRPVMIHFSGIEGARRAATDPEHPWFGGMSGFDHVLVTGDITPAEPSIAEKSELRRICSGRDVYIFPPAHARMDDARQLSFHITATSAASMSAVRAEERWDVGTVYVSEMPDLFPRAWDFSMEVPFEKERLFGFRVFLGLFRLGGLLAIARRSPNGRSVTHELTKYGQRSLIHVSKHGLVAETERPWEYMKLDIASNFYRRFTVGVGDGYAKISSAILSSEGREVSAIGYEPRGLPTIASSAGELCLNTWKPPSRKPKKGSIRPIIRLLHSWGMDAWEKRAMLVFIACVIKGIKPQWGVLVTSLAHGVGKNTLGDFLAEVAGPWNASFPSAENLKTDNRVQWAFGVNLVVVSEIYEGHSWKMFHRMKSFVTDSKFRVEPKYVGSYDMDNHLSIMLFSNVALALRIEEADRRWFVYHVDRYIQKPTSYWRELRKWFYLGGGAEALLEWGLSVDLAKLGKGKILFDGHAPETEDRQVLIDESRPEWAHYLDRLTELVILADVKKFVGDQELKKPVMSGEIEAALVKKGYRRVHVKKQVKIDNRRDIKVQIWGRGDRDNFEARELQELLRGDKFGLFSAEWAMKLGDPDVN